MRSLIFGALMLAGCQTSGADTPRETPAPVATAAAVEPPADVPQDIDAAESPAPTAQTPPFVCPTPPEGMACIPGGEFVRGKDDDPHACDQDHQPDDRRSAAVPAAKVSVSPFFMDLTEVTVEAYTACVKAGKCPNSGPVYADYRAPKQPITGTPWFDAVSFCEWKGKRLPTEAEWEFAARGPRSETYPWGEDPVTCERAVIMDASGRSCGQIKRRGKNPEKGRVLEVGSRPAGRYGLYDMVGNAEEWVADWWTPTYADCGESCLGKDPKGPCDGKAPCGDLTYRAVRGGSWYWPAEHATGYHRRRHHPDNHPFHHFGFRCAQSIEPTL
ncbi:MAG: SUMF1/EgtB/PvdO family nonheme iron enzyme [bacterium]